MERTLILVKPDGVQRGLIGEIIKRFEARGLKIVGMKFINVPRSLAEAHYAEHAGKAFYDGLLDYIMSGPVVALVLEGKRAIELARQTMGKTRPWEAEVGTIRADLAMDVGRNLVHGSANAEDAAREVALWFADAELISWTPAADAWVVGD